MLPAAELALAVMAMTRRRGRLEDIFVGTNRWMAYRAPAEVECRFREVVL
jgi:hypothetical protein